MKQETFNCHFWSCMHKENCSGVFLWHRWIYVSACWFSNHDVEYTLKCKLLVFGEIWAVISAVDMLHGNPNWWKSVMNERSMPWHCVTTQVNIYQLWHFGHVFTIRTSDSIILMRLGYYFWQANLTFITEAIVLQCVVCFSAPRFTAYPSLSDIFTIMVYQLHRGHHPCISTCLVQNIWIPLFLSCFIECKLQIII